MWGKRLPWDDLEHYLYAHFELARERREGIPFERKVQPWAAADLLNVNRQTIHRWVAYGVPFYSADRIASELSTHPMEIWPAHYLEVQLCG
jgi:hypothetical protein